MKQIFKDDKKGETSLDIVRAICRTVKSKNFNVSPAVGYYNIQMHREIGYFHNHMYFHQILKIIYHTLLVNEQVYTKITKLKPYNSFINLFPLWLTSDTSILLPLSCYMYMIGFIILPNRCWTHFWC